MTVYSFVTLVLTNGQTHILHYTRCGFKIDFPQGWLQHHRDTLKNIYCFYILLNISLETKLQELVETNQHAVNSLQLHVNTKCMLYVKMIFYPIAGIFRVVIQCKMSLLVSQFSKCFPLNLHTRHTVIINPHGFIYCNVSTVMLNGSHCVTLNHVVLGVCFFVLRKGKLIFHLIMYLAADTSVLYLFY